MPIEQFALLKTLSENGGKLEMPVTPEKIKEEFRKFLSEEKINGELSVLMTENKIEYKEDNGKGFYVITQTGMLLLQTEEQKLQQVEKENEAYLQTQHQGIGIFSADKFVEIEIPVPEFLVGGMILNKSLTIIGGNQSSFKTHFATYLALCASNGKPLFDKFECKETNVLYINEELYSGEFQRLLIRLSNGTGLKIPENLIVMNFLNWKIDNEEDNKKLIELIKKHNIQLAIFDTFRECFNAAENSADEITMVLHEYCRPIINETGCSLLIIMHKGKISAGTEGRQPVDMIRGSSVFRNYADSIILLERERKQERVNFKHEKIRGARELEDFNITWVFDDSKKNGNISAKVLSEEELEKLLVDECVNAISEFLKKEGVEQFETGEKTKIFKKLVESKKFSNGTFYQALKELQVQGEIRRLQRGKYEVVGRGLNEF